MRCRPARFSANSKTFRRTPCATVFTCATPPSSLPANVRTPAKQGPVRDYAKRPTLGDGASWGDDVPLSALQVGDLFHLPGTPRRGTTGGVITKLARVNVTYTSQYMGRPLPGLQIRRTELAGGYVARGLTVHALVFG